MTEIVTYREIQIQIKISTPTAGAYEDYTTQLKRMLQRVVNTQSVQKRHGVRVTAPGMPWGSTRDTDFVVDIVPIQTRFVQTVPDEKA